MEEVLVQRPRSHLKPRALLSFSAACSLTVLKLFTSVVFECPSSVNPASASRFSYHRPAPRRTPNESLGSPSVLQMMTVVKMSVSSSFFFFAEPGFRKELGQISTSGPAFVCCSGWEAQYKIKLWVKIMQLSWNLGNVLKKKCYSYFKKKSEI